MKDQDQLTSFEQQLKYAQLPEGKGKEKIWAAIVNELPGTRTHSGQNLRWWAAAASLVLMAFLSYLYWSNGVYSYATARAEMTAITLPDESVVTLNADSRLEVSKRWNRQVQLEGEAFFEVVKGSTFEVKTPKGIVQVLGTSFNVNTRANQLTVQCKTGRVAVQVPVIKHQSVLRPGDEFKLVNQSPRKISNDSDRYGKWTEGEFHFDNAPLQTVMDEISRQFDIPIELQLETPRQFTGYFKNTTINDALETVCLPLGLTFTKEKGKYQVAAP